VVKAAWRRPLTSQRSAGSVDRSTSAWSSVPGWSKAGMPTPDVAWIGGVAFGLDRQIADDVDALAGCGVLKGDAGWAHDADLADSWTVQLCDCSADTDSQSGGNVRLARGEGRLHSVA
jgi:hypothetical protein